MKTVLFLVLLALSSIVNAQARDATEDEFKWLVLASVIATDPDSIQWYGISDESGKKVVAFAKDIREKDIAFQKQYAAAACQQKGKSMEELARYFDHHQGEPDALRRELLKDFSAQLQPGEEDFFWRAAHENSGITVGDVEKTSDTVREQRMSTYEIADAFCK